MTSNSSGTGTSTDRGARRWRDRAPRGGLVAALVGVLLAGLVPVGTAVADTKSRAVDIMSQGDGDFLKTKRTGEAPFDWSSDGCSWTPHRGAGSRAGPASCTTSATATSARA
jgi:hypothetical protein